MPSAQRPAASDGCAPGRPGTAANPLLNTRGNERPPHRLPHSPRRLFVNLATTLIVSTFVLLLVIVDQAHDRRAHVRQARRTADAAAMSELLARPGSAAVQPADDRGDVATFAAVTFAATFAAPARAVEPCGRVGLAWTVRAWLGGGCTSREGGAGIRGCLD
eukprot:279479-Prymnesium_polylepis.1